MSPASLPLSGIKVLDLSKILAGPICAQHLGELGAEVIKVEPVGSGDDTRNWLPKQQGESAMFMAVNHNKRSLALDLKHPDGQAIVHQLAQQSDVVLQGFGGGAAQRLGVDYDTLAQRNDRLIYCEISGYGRDGPMGDDPGYDVMLQAFSGMISSIGEPDGEVARVSFSPVDLGTGQNALSAILAALFQRHTTGKGQYVEECLLDTAMSYMGYLAQTYWQSGQIPSPMGTGHPSMVPYQAFDASDGKLMIGAGNDAQWRRFCTLADLEAYVDHPDFKTSVDRVNNREQTVALVQARIATHSVAHWLRLLRAAKIPCAPVQSLDRALAHPQVQARGLIATSQHPLLGAMQQIGIPMKFNGQDRHASRPPPLLGEHSVQILRELGHNDAQVAALLSAGVVATTPSKEV